MVCAFCGREQGLTHWCLLERREAEAAASLAAAESERLEASLVAMRQTEYRSAAIEAAYRQVIGEVAALKQKVANGKA